MKGFIDAVDKIHSDVVPSLVEKMQHILAKFFGRDEKSIIAHMFILRWGSGWGLCRGK
ncbi:hypothetical protein [Holospora undulata]|uniref:hypothetical protein n=1 Tax=Holospora undulata TaxID=1169117 RepID=UPI0003C503C8|nr:hypothetical protein [Holospora undulata]